MEMIKNIIGSETITVVVIWIATVLIAGFIAQFGKRFADYLTDRIKNARAKKSGGPAGAAALEKSPSGIRPGLSGEERGRTGQEERARIKAEKKMAKSAAKQKKKKS
jgi:hypothetical protein